MTNTTYITFVDGEAKSWELSYLGELTSFVDHMQIPERSKVLFERLPSEGYLVVPRVGLDVIDEVRERICTILLSNGVNCEELCYYHLNISDESHHTVTRILSNLTFADLARLNVVLKTVAEALGLNLSDIISDLGRSHVQVRIVRPGRIDFNPPHRDSYLDYYRSVVNVWLPIVCDPEGVMPVVPGSHFYDECDIQRTENRSAILNGNRYTVPAITSYLGEPLSMRRPKVAVGDLLVFSPYLIHGFGLNETNFTRMAVELRLQIN